MVSVTRDTNINDPFLTFVLHGDLYFKRIYVHPLPVFYFPNQDLGRGGEGSKIFFFWSRGIECMTLGEFVEGYEKIIAIKKYRLPPPPLWCT